MSRYRYVAVLAGCLLMIQVGCTGKSEKPIKVEGVVTLDGKPVDRAMVSFIPVDKGGHQANGQTGNDGTFHLTTYTSGDGAIPGDYKVIISKAGAHDSENNVAPKVDDPKDFEKMKSMMMSASKPHRPEKGTLPADYSDLSKTQLKARVPHDGPVTFELRSGGGT